MEFSNELIVGLAIGLAIGLIIGFLVSTWPDNTTMRRLEAVHKWWPMQPGSDTAARRGIKLTV